MQPAGALDCVYRGAREDLELRIRVGEVILLAEQTAAGSHHRQRAPLGSCEVELVLYDYETPAAQREVIEGRTVEVRPAESVEVIFD